MVVTSSSRINDPIVDRLVDNHRQFLAFLAERVANPSDAEEILQAAYARGWNGRMVFTMKRAWSHGSTDSAFGSTDSAFEIIASTSCHPTASTLRATTHQKPTSGSIAGLINRLFRIV